VITLLNQCLLTAASGLAAGFIHFTLLRYQTELLVAQGPALRIIASLLARFAVSGAAFWLAVQYGAIPLVVALGGWLVGRYLLTRERRLVA